MYIFLSLPRAAPREAPGDLGCRAASIIMMILVIIMTIVIISSIVTISTSVTICICMSICIIVFTY